VPVVDASVLVEYLAGGEHAEQAREGLLGSGEMLWAPHLVDAEVGHVLRSAVLRGELKPERATATLQDLAALPMQRAGHVALLERAWALRRNLTFYDALYVALAERLDVPLVTLDGRLQRAPGIRAAIQVLV
jgi:predicted nucleic acid-binding protein